jgi:transposase
MVCSAHDAGESYVTVSYAIRDIVAGRHRTEHNSAIVGNELRRNERAQELLAKLGIASPRRFVPEPRHARSSERARVNHRLHRCEEVEHRPDVPPLRPALESTC